MDVALIAARIVHFAAQISLEGVFGFAVLAAAPSYADSGAAMPPRLSRRLALDAWLSLALTALSGLAWLMLVAKSMSGVSLADVFARGIAGIVLTTTQFGHVWILRAVLVLLLVPCVAMTGKRRGIERIGLLLGAALLAATAWEGHAGAAQGWELPVHLAADSAHIVAAGTWIGALVPLTLLLAETRRRADRSAAVTARAAASRFSELGLWCVVTLLMSGTINAWFLVGSIPALVGTTYGQLVMAKIALLMAMIALAYVNRMVLLPRLATTDHGNKAVESRKAVAKIARNARIEAGLGLAAIAIVGVLGTLVPAAHQQPRWPFSYRLSLDAIAGAPELRNEAITTALLAALGLVLLLVGLDRRRWITATAGLALFLGLGWRPIELLAVAATPTSYSVSPEPFAVGPILAGGTVYAANCASCHGEEGQGDGPLGAALPIPPSDLTAAALLARSDGDLFWLVSEGMDSGVMPGFAQSLDATRIWDTIAFLKARAAGWQAATMSAEVTVIPAPLAPDFAFAAPADAPGSLKAVLEHSAVLLMFDEAAQSARQAQLDGWRAELAAHGVAIIEISDAPDIRAVYALYERQTQLGPAPPMAHIEFLIDRDGYIRARWRPGDVPDWQNLTALEIEIGAMGRLKLAPVAAAGHVH